MPTINTQDLTGTALDWAVAQAEGIDAAVSRVHQDGTRSIVRFYSDDGDGVDGRVYSPSEHPNDGHHIIDRERICTDFMLSGNWLAVSRKVESAWHYGPTMLIAAMRCYVASKLGPTVDVPQELLS